MCSNWKYSTPNVATFIVVALLLYTTTIISPIYAQPPVLRYRIENADTLYFDYLPPAIIWGKRKFKDQKSYRAYYRLVRNLYKVYPYVKIVRHQLAVMNDDFVRLEGKKERKAYLKKVEKQLFEEFDAPLRKLTISQGQLLIKLLDRETGRSSFELLKEFRGGFTAFFWQNTARIFGHNLKTKYDKDGDDQLLEELVLMCENNTFESLYLSMYSK